MVGKGVLETYGEYSRYVKIYTEQRVSERCLLLMMMMVMMVSLAYLLHPPIRRGRTALFLSL